MSKHSSRFLQVVEDAKSRIKETDCAAVKAKQEEKTSFYLVDVREDREWSKSHIIDAIHLGKGVIERDIEKVIPDLNAEIIVYCGSGFRSALAAESLQKMGYTQVVSMDGGFRDWHAKGYPLDYSKE